MTGLQDLSTWEAETGEWQFQGQPGPQGETLSQRERERENAF